MNFRQLKYFTEIVDAGSFLKASKNLLIAQPALSQHIASLEDELGTQLFIRSPRGVTVTAAGEVLYQHGKKILGQLKQAKDDVRDEVNIPKGDVAVVFPPMLSIYVAPRLVKEIELEYPDINLRPMEARSLTSQAMVERGRADLGLIAGDKPKGNLNSEIIYEEPLFFIEQYPSSEPETVTGGQISFSELSRKPLVLSQKSHALRAMLEELSEKKKLPLNIKLETESTRLIEHFVTEGVAHGVFPWPSIYKLCQDKKIVARRIVKPEMSRQIYLSWPSSYPLNTATMIVKEKILSILEDLYQEGVIVGEWLR
ncbi:LysR family transcriptional regulator [Photobacterium sanctipauli]|uniref:LysR family transcriptional regulator n=1 Tax=Photobacterium sanctipauli TaxID=1342794 RepID=A0A2T3NWB0_9GAMM|nr:LysR family transcriptional regulator [Photobacterium sanctipauli]PSW20584.1 LysR family transcriptional regulator [Photobacterium sanctipauli]